MEVTPEEDPKTKSNVRLCLRRFARDWRAVSGAKHRDISTRDGAHGTGSEVGSQMPRLVRKCKVHQSIIEGLSYDCPACHSTFCLACITNVLLPEGRCMICSAPLVMDLEARRFIDRSIEISKMSNMVLLPGETLTMITPEIWKRFEELQLSDEIIEEVIDRMKHVPPEDRLKYLDAYFADTDMNDDEH